MSLCKGTRCYNFEYNSTNTTGKGASFVLDVSWKLLGPFCGQKTLRVLHYIN